MTKVGYHHSLFTISMTYPRRCLATEAEKTMQDVGIIHDITLNVEEKEEDDYD